MILYVLIGLVLASFIFAFLSAKTWHWGYVVLVEALFLATLGFFFLAAETLRINAVYRKQIDTTQKQVDETIALNEALKNGTANGTLIEKMRNADPPLKVPENTTALKSIEKLDHELLIATRKRGRIWRNIVPAGPIDPKTGAIRITFAAPRPAPAAEAPAPGEAPPAEKAAAPAATTASPANPNLKADTVVYMFEDGAPQAPAENGAPRGPQFLGEFNVVQAAGQQATLQPTQPLGPNDFESKRLGASRGPWILYETMPLDRPEVYAGLSEDQLKQILPAKTVNEFIRDGKEATNDDDPWRKIGFDESGKPLPAGEFNGAAKVTYQRRLRDYAAEFDELSRRRIALIADMDAVQKDIDQLKAAQKIAEALQSQRTDERKKLTSDLTGVTKEREAIEKHLENVRKLLEKAQQLTTEMMARNRQLAAQLNGQQSSAPPAGNGHGSTAKPASSLTLNSAK